MQAKIQHQCASETSKFARMYNRDMIQISPIGGISVENLLKELPLQPENNNIVETIRRRKFEYSTEPVYMEDVPKSFSCRYGILSSRVC